MKLIDLLFGQPLASSEEEGEKVGVAAGIPIFGLDALSSAAYGPEAALTLLIPLGVAGLSYIVPISFSIIILLVIVCFSYQQTIPAYPNGGGSYTVAHENLGVFPGLLAAAALLIDYTLDAAVGISAGIGALVSALPSLHAHTLGLCLLALVILTLVNLRGVRESGGVFLIPTYLFLVCIGTAILIGIAKAIASGGHPTPIDKPLVSATTVATVSAWLLIKSFASGCTALTGVEAVSNGVRAFRDPAAKNAARTLTLIIAALIVMLGGIAYLVKAYGIVATDPNSGKYQSILSMLLAAVAGRGWFYYVSITSVLLILIFSANTAFADFPRVCRFVAEDGFLPISFANRGRRLVYSEGIIVLSVVTAALLIVFGGVTDRLIPLFAVGAFLAFTMSQAGMVAHWRREGGPKARRSMLINGVGATATGLTVCVIIVAKFSEGAWITVIAIPLLITLMYAVGRHYKSIRKEIATDQPLKTSDLHTPVLIIAMSSWTKLGSQALRTAMTLTDEIKVLHIAEGNQSVEGADSSKEPGDKSKNQDVEAQTQEDSDEFTRRWEELVVEPARKANLPIPRLIIQRSEFRFVITPIVRYVVQAAKDYPDRRIILIVPELVEKHWYHYFLHTQRATLLKARLLVEGNNRISVLNIPFYLKTV